jgi:tetratricopeptide (TPR) repeat protein
MALRGQSVDRAVEECTLAIADLTRAIRIDPDNAMAYFERARTRVNDEEGELADYDEAVRLAPESADYRFSRGCAYQLRGEHDRAIPDFSEAIRLDPDRSWYHTQQAESYRTQGDDGRSEDDLARVRSLEARP